MKIHEYQGKEILRKYGVPTPKGFPAFSVDEALEAANKLVGKVVDRGTQRVALMASSEGGMDIEEVAAKTPEKIHKVFIDPASWLTDREATELARKIGVPTVALGQASELFKKLYKAFWDIDASLAEINPLIITNQN